MDEGKNRVTVYLVKAHGQLLVRPSWVVVKPGDNEMEVRNHAGEDVDLVLPPSFYIPNPPASRDRTIEAGTSKVVPLHVSEEVEPGAHAYGFYGAKSREFAVGDSSPIFIVDR